MTTRCSPGRALSSASAFALLLAGQAPGATNVKTACTQSFERTQELRLDGKRRDARELARQCALPSCPGAVRPLCAKWVDELEAELSSVVVSVHDEAGHPIVAARATLDGVDIPTGSSVWLDPGSHEVGARHEGRQSKRSFQTKAGEQGTPIVLVLVPTTPATTPPPSTTSPPADPTHQPGPRAGAFVAAGVAALGLAAFVYYGSSGKRERAELAESCAPHCSDEQVSSVRKKYLFADVGLATAVVAGSLATYWFVKPTQATAVTLGPRGVALRVGF